jgi:hypothetical protein
VGACASGGLPGPIPAGTRYRIRQPVLQDEVLAPETQGWQAIDTSLAVPSLVIKGARAASQDDIGVLERRCPMSTTEGLATGFGRDDVSGFLALRLGTGSGNRPAQRLDLRGEW